MSIPIGGLDDMTHLRDTAVRYSGYLVAGWTRLFLAMDWPTYTECQGTSAAEAAAKYGTCTVLYWTEL